MIIKRIENNKKEPVSEDNLTNDPRQISIIKFSNLNSKQIYQLIDQIPENVFSLFSNDQLIGLDLQRISQEQVDHLFSVNPGARIALLTPDQIYSIFDKLNDWQIEHYITDDQFQELNLPALTANQIQRLLYNHDAKRIALLTPDQIYSIFDKLNNFQIMQLITDDQFKQLNLATLKANQIQQLLYNHDAKRIALLTSDQIYSIFDKLNDFQIKYLITDDQFKQLNLATLKANQIQQLLYNHDAKRIALLTPDQLNSIFDKLNDWQIKHHIANSQLKLRHGSNLIKNGYHKAIKNLPTFRPVFS